MSVGCAYVIDLPSGGNLTHTLMPDNGDLLHGESHALFGCRVRVSGGQQVTLSLSRTLNPNPNPNPKPEP